MQIQYELDFDNKIESVLKTKGDSYTFDKSGIMIISLSALANTGAILLLASKLYNGIISSVFINWTGLSGNSYKDIRNVFVSKGDTITLSNLANYSSFSVNFVPFK